jgi:DNA-binding SARP family transcriptional activator
VIEKEVEMIEFKVLGPVEIVFSGRPIRISAPKPRRILALMALRANQVVGLESMIEELWDQQLPKTAVTTVQTYIYQLRRLLAEHANAEDAKILETRSMGYMLVLRDGQLDAAEYLRLIEGAVTTGRLLEAHLVHLNELWRRALELRIETDLELGRHRALIPELRYLITEDPLNEWLHGRLIMALERSGRRGEALQVYQQLRRILHDEIGLEPSEELRRIQREVLTA